MDVMKFVNIVDYEKLLRKCLSLESKDWFGDDAIEFVINSRITRRFSFILKVSANFHSQEMKNLIIKIPRDSSMIDMFQPISSEKLQHEAKTEAALLANIYQYVNDSGDDSLAAIKIFGYVPQLCAVVMEEINMKLLSDDIKKFPYYPRTFEAREQFLTRVMRGGRWLRNFHEANGLKKIIRLSDVSYLEEVESALHRLENVSGLNHNDLRKSFFRAYERIIGDPVEITALHNDFHLGNVFVTTDEKIGVFDPNISTSGPAYQDVARMLVDLDSRRIQLLSFGLFYEKSLLAEFKSAVIEGYFDALDVNQEMLNFFCALELIKKWRVNEEYFGDHQNTVIKGLKTFVSPLSRRFFKNLISKYLV